MIHLHVTKEVFNRILSGEKTKEYRPDSERYRKMFAPILYTNNHIEHLRIYKGYPKKDDKKNIIDAAVTCCYWCNTSSPNIDQLFFKYYPDYKECSVIVIEFEKIDGKA